MKIYYIPDITLPQLYLRCTWHDSDTDYHRQFQNLICQDKETAIIKAKEILKAIE
jgi:hypothetical protein